MYVNYGYMVYFKHVPAGSLPPCPINGKVMIYDAKTNVWSEGKTPSTVYDKTILTTGGCMTAGIYAPKRVYAFGLGNGPEQPVLSNWVHDPVYDTWSTIKNMPTCRDQFGVAVVDDILYVMGGKDAFGYDIFSVNEQYIPRGYSGPLPPVTFPTITPVQSNTPAASESEPSTLLKLIDVSLNYFCILKLNKCVSK